MGYNEERDAWQDAEGGYNHIQGTKPQTLSYGLNDSPVGLCAWIVEKWRSWSDCDGEVEKRFTKDELLTNVMVYWVTQSIGSSCRLYYESRRTPWYLEEGENIQVPCAVAIFPRELFHPPREFAQRSPEPAAVRGDAPGWPLQLPGGAGAVGRGGAPVLQESAVRDSGEKGISSLLPLCGGGLALHQNRRSASNFVAAKGDFVASPSSSANTGSIPNS